MKSFLTTGLSTVIKKYVQPEPQQITNLSIPRGSCNCPDCSRVNAFLASSHQKQFDFPCAKKRRAHLHGIFTDAISRSGSHAQYRVETLRNSNPNVWRITKTFDQLHATRHAEWTKRVKWLNAELRKLEKAPCSLLSREILGDSMFEGIMSCSVENLEEKIRIGPRMPLGEGNGNARKRRADNDGEDGVKKARTEPGVKWPGGVEIIDLT